MAAISSNATTANWNTNGAWSGGTQPGVGDDVTVVTGANITIPAATTALCKSWTVQTGATVTFAATTSALNIGTTTAGAGNVAISISSGATITLTGTGTISLISTSATQQTINSGGRTLPNLTINGANSSYVLAAALSAATLTVSAGTFSTSASNFAMTLTAFNYGNTGSRTITLGSSLISLSAASSGFTGTNITNLTVTANTAIMTFTSATTGTNSVFVLGNKDWNGLSMVINGGGQGALNIGGTTARLKNLTINGTASQIDSFRFSSDLTLTGTFTVTGNSAVNRPMIYGVAPGTANTITAVAVSLTNVDFMDIAGAGAATWTGSILGDRLGNSGITFTAAATQTRDATAGQAWSVAARWTSRVPLPQDDVILNASSGSISSTDVFVLGKSVTATNYTGTITGFSSSTPYVVFGNMSFGGTFTQPNTWYLEYRGRGSHTITSNGKVAWCGSSNGRHYIYAPGGSYSLADAYNLTVGTSGRSIFSINAGTFNTNNFTMQLAQMTMSATTNARAVNLGTSIINHYTSSSTALMDYAATNLTYSGASATHNITGSTLSNVNKIWTGGGGSFGTLNFNEAGGMGVLTVTGANTFAGFNVGPNRKVRFTASTTTTFTSAPTFAGQNNGYARGVTGQVYIASAPDSVSLSITDNLDARWRLALDSVSLAGSQRIGGKYSSTALTKSWRCFITAGFPAWSFSSDGTADLTTATATASLSSVGATNGNPFWLRVTRERSTGNVKFYYAPDNTSMPSSWTQIGTTVVNNAGVAMYDSSTLVTVGGDVSATNANPGNYYWFQLRNNILDDGSGIQLDMKLQDKAFGVDTFTEGSVNAATVTMYDAAGVQAIGDGRVQIESVTAATHTLSSANAVEGAGMKVTNSIASGSVPFYAGATSFDGTGNTNWTFSASSTGGFFEFF